MDIPEHYIDIVGSVQSLGGGLFCGKQDLPYTEYKILDWRIGTAQVVNVKELRETGESSYNHPTIEYLLKNDNMKRSRWSRGFAIREINLKKTEHE